jgi:hypothetical protein
MLWYNLVWAFGPGGGEYTIEIEYIKVFRGIYYIDTFHSISQFENDLGVPNILHHLGQMPIPSCTIA